MKKIEIMGLLCVLFLGATSFADPIKIPLNPLRELDFKGDEEIFSVRKKMIKKYPILIEGAYEPKKSSVFSQVEAGKAWWGMQGIDCYGPGHSAIEGKSEETRFIDNPFLLVSIEESSAFPVMKQKKTCTPYYPKPTDLTYNPDTKTFRVVYNVSGYLKGMQQQFKQNGVSFPPITFLFGGRNAIDLGLPFGYASKVKNIEFSFPQNVASQVYKFRNFIHVGGSCGYSGGCNNGSPYQKELEFKVQKYPAGAIFKLWKTAPASADEAADITFKIIIN